MCSSGPEHHFDWHQWPTGGRPGASCGGHMPALAQPVRLEQEDKACAFAAHLHSLSLSPSLTCFLCLPSGAMSPSPQQHRRHDCSWQMQLHRLIPLANISATSTSTSLTNCYFTSCLGKAAFCPAATTPSPERRHAHDSPWVDRSTTPHASTFHGPALH